MVTWLKLPYFVFQNPNTSWYWANTPVERRVERIEVDSGWLAARDVENERIAKKLIKN